MKPANDHKRQAKGGRVERVVGLRLDATSQPDVLPRARMMQAIWSIPGYGVLADKIGATILEVSEDDNIRTLDIGGRSSTDEFAGAITEKFSKE